MHYARIVRPTILEALSDTRVVFVVGARQAGKTTLVSGLAQDEWPMESFTLDDQAVRDAALNDPAGFIAGLELPVVIDEVQRAPDLLLEIKKAVDRDQSPGQFLLTGSANILATKRVKDALTGRVETIKLWPLMQAELEGSTNNFIDAMFNGLPRITNAPVGRDGLKGRLTEGGFPEAVRRNPRRRSAWFRSYLDSTLDRDLRDISDAAKTEAMPGLLRLLASQAANVLTYRRIAEGLDLNHETVKTYVGLLEQLSLIQRLPGWRPGFGSRETAKPKIYVVDTGILCYLLGAGESRAITDDQVTGRATENFVAMEILRHQNWANSDTRIYHYHQADRDVDLVIERSDGMVAAVEIKSSATVRSGDYKWLRYLRDKLGTRFVAGTVICTTDRTVPLGDRLWAVPISALWA